MSTLIIPKQSGESNSGIHQFTILFILCIFLCFYLGKVTMTNEEEFYEYCFSNNLLTFGWIHTHPSQVCSLFVWNVVLNQCIIKIGLFHVIN